MTPCLKKTNHPPPQKVNQSQGWCKSFEDFPCTILKRIRTKSAFLSILLAETLVPNMIVLKGETGRWSHCEGRASRLGLVSLIHSLFICPLKIWEEICNQGGGIHQEPGYAGTLPSSTENCKQQCALSKPSSWWFHCFGNLDQDRFLAFSRTEARPLWCQSPGV